MKSIGRGLLVALALALVSCGSAQSTGSPNASVSPSATPSPTNTPSPSHTARPGWKTYVSTRWGYSIDYPADWFDLDNFGAPDTEKYFSNEKVGAPLEMTAHGVWETMEVQPNSTGSCPPSYVAKYVVRQSPTTVDNISATRYVINQTPSGGEAGYLIGIWVMHGGSCYSIQFLSSIPATRDANADVADQTISSFKFGS
jgi:hypothetical protein